MARLLIVSRSMALAMRLADQHEVVEHPADDLDSLLPNLDADVLVLDLGDPVLAVNTVNSLREADQAIPVLLVSGYQPEWEQVEAQQVDGVHVVPLPITRVALLQGVAALTGEDSGVTFVQTDPVQESPAAPPGAKPTAAPQIPRASTPAGPPAESKPAAAPESTTPASAKPDAAPKPTAKPDAQPSRPAAFNAPPPAPQPASAKSPPVPSNPTTPEIPTTAGPTGPVGPAANPAAWGVPPRTGEVPAVTQSEAVEGVSYSSALTRPFDQHPRTGQFQLPAEDTQPTPPVAPRWARHAPGQSTVNPAEPAPEPPRGTTNGNAMARRMQRLGNRPRKLQRRSGPAETVEPRTPTGMGLVTDPLGPRTDPYGFPASALDRRLDADAAAMVTRGGMEGGFALRTAELVRMLHERAGDLYSVSDTAQVLADDVIERADADAAAILVPDGPIWRVGGGVGLRPLERRLELEESHWLITEIGSAGRAVLIEDTDIIRQQLSGAPLAAWRHLLAVPVPDVRGIVVLARGKEGGPFTDRDLSAVIAPVRESAALLAQAVETRRLARMLSPLREES
jgi:CheY-like chemotaxis protein